VVAITMCSNDAVELSCVAFGHSGGLHNTASIKGRSSRTGRNSGEFVGSITIEEQE
jgi:hypothetical protein